MKKLLELESADPVDWCERNITLDYGAFDRARHPLLVEPLRAAARMRGGIVGIIGSVQHIKTLTSQLWHLYNAELEPARSAAYDLTEQAVKEFSEDKFTPLIESTENILSHISSDRTKRTRAYIGFAYGFIRLLSAGVLSNLNSKTLERVSLDEAWGYEPGTLKMIRDRQASFPWSWQTFIPSSGQTKNSELDQLWERSTKRIWHVPCDHCGEMIPYIWTPDQVDGEIPQGGMRFLTGDDVRLDDGSINWPKLRSSVYYECQECGGRHDWSAGDVHRRNSEGRYIQTNPDGEAKIDIYNYNAMAHYPWPDLVEEWQQASLERGRGELSGLENFVRKRLASAWDVSSFVSEGESPKGRGDYELGEVWPEVQYIFATVDVQQDHYYIIVRGWAMIGERLLSRQLERKRVVSVEQIKALADKWKIPQGGIDGSVGCRVFLDGNYNTAEVRRICLQNGWMLLRGDDTKDYKHEDGIRRIYAPIQYVDALQGTGGQGRGNFCGQFFFSNLEARNRLALIRGIREPDPIWTYPGGEGVENYEKQLNSWIRFAKTRKKDGATYYDWIQRGADDHYHDCEKMQIVCAAMAGLVGGSAATAEDSKNDEAEE